MTDSALTSCMICGRQITTQYAVCATCEKTYGLGPMREWPEWARALWADTKAERREIADELRARDDTFLGSDRYDYLAYGEPNEDPRQGGAAQGDYRAQDDNGIDLLRYAPYANEADNRAYRQANGIGER